MSTSYYMRLKDDHTLDNLRDTLNTIESNINELLEKEADILNKIVTRQTERVIETDNFNKQFCNAADWYGSYPDEPEDYHLRRISLESIEHIEVLIGTYSGNEFHWKLNSLKDGYYECELIKEPFNIWNDKKVFEFPRSKEQFKEFMKKYKDKVEIVDEYNEVYTVTQFLKKVDEY